MLTLYTAVGILRFQDSIKEHKTPTVINNRQEYGLTEEEFFLWSSLAFQILESASLSMGRWKWALEGAKSRNP